MTSTRSNSTITTPSTQRALLLRAIKERYELVHDFPLPALEGHHEVLVRVEAIGLNPVDWKSADYGFALPSLPALNGRDLAGVVVRVGADVKRLRVGDRIFGPSTEYRDYRTSAFQQYAVASEHCMGLVPEGSSVEVCAAIGVGAVTAALAIGSALGISVRGFAPRDLAVGAEGESPEWMTASTSTATHDLEVLGSSSLLRPRPAGPSTPSPQSGEFILIWGASTTTGFFAAQFARLAGLQVIAVANVSRHARRLYDVGVSHVVDRLDPAAAVAEVRRISGGQLRYAIDCVGKETVGFAMAALDTEQESWLVGLSGLPTVPGGRVRLCEVPIKTFHSNAAVGSALMRLIEDLLESDELVLPQVEIIEGGLGAINGALDRLRVGDVGFGRLVIRTPHV